MRILKLPQMTVPPKASLPASKQSSPYSAFLMLFDADRRNVVKRDKIMLFTSMTGRVGFPVISVVKHNFSVSQNVIELGLDALLPSLSSTTTFSLKTDH